jgi:hypothetical protein
MTDDDIGNGLPVSRRKLLGAAGIVGGAGALGGLATTSLLWDEEKFGNANDPNVLQGGELDLKVDWEGTYYDWIDNPTFSSDTDGDGEPDLVDQPGPIIELEDVKPGDVIELTQSAHVFGNPAFLGWHYEEHLNSDNGINEPEDKVDGHIQNDSDGTEGGDLADYIQVVIWYDDGDNLPDEITGALLEAGVLPAGATIDEDDDGELDIPEEDYVMALANVQDASPLGALDPVAYAGTLSGLDGTNVLFNASMSNATDTNESDDGTDADENLVAEGFSDYCYEASATEYIAVLAWVPRDIEGVNDNIIQTDRLEFQFGFEAIQCRHNVANDGTPFDETIYEADEDNNARSPGSDPPGQDDDNGEGEED